MTFNVWIGELLRSKWDAKAKATAHASRARIEKEQSLEKVRSSEGVLDWAMNYQKTLHAWRQEYFGKARAEQTYGDVPAESDTISIGDGMYLSKKGTVWTGDMVMGKLMYKILGSAFVNEVV